MGDIVLKAQHFDIRTESAELKINRRERHERKEKNQSHLCVLCELCGKYLAAYDRAYPAARAALSLLCGLTVNLSKS